MDTTYDVAVIGGGIIGALTLRELSRYRLRTVLCEKQADFGCGVTAANSAIIHAGFDPEPGTRKAEFNLPGCLAYPQLCRELSADLEPKASLVVAYSEAEEATVQALYQRGLDRGVPQLSLLSAEMLRREEPGLSPRARMALRAGCSAIVEPWNVAIDAVENALENGAEALREAEVTEIAPAEGGGYRISFRDGRALRALCVVNCAGLGAERIHAMVEAPDFHLIPRKGQYYVLDRAAEGLVHNVCFAAPTENGKGVLITPAVHGKFLIGPDAVRCDDPEEAATTPEGLAFVRECAAKYLAHPLPMQQSIRVFAGVRPTPDTGDFLIRRVTDGFVEAAGIESPGIASAPAIAGELCRLVTEELGGAERRDDFLPNCRPRVHFARCSPEEQRSLIARDPAYANLICRCETVTEAEIVDCIRRPAGATTVKGVKMRAGAGFGRCQSGFCQPKVTAILARELCVSPDRVRYANAGSEILSGRTKEGPVHG